MKFESTFKQFSKYSLDEFNKMYNEKYSSNTTIHFNFKMKGYQSFFAYSIPIFEKVLMLQAKNSTLNHLFNSLPPIAKHQYIRNTLVIEVKKTNELEGVFSSKKEIFELTEELKNSKSNKIGSIVNKYMMLLESKEANIKTCSDIRKIYEEMFMTGNKTLISKKDYPDGKYFRKSFVGVFDLLGNKHHSAPLGEEVIIDIISEGIKLLNNSEINVFIRLALFHFIFEYCHPFYDGNGRIGRYLISLKAKEEISDIFAFRISAGIKAKSSLYQKAFKETEDVRNRGDITTFVDKFFDILSNEYDESIKYASEKKQKLDEILNKYISIEKYTKSENSVLGILAQAYVFSDFGVTIKQIAETVNISSRTVIRAIEKIAERGLIASQKFSKTIFYNLKLDSDC